MTEISDKISMLDDADDAIDDDADSEQSVLLIRERSALEGERHDIEQSRMVVPIAEDKALAGAVLSLDDSGKLVIRRDVIRPADWNRMVKLLDDPAGGGARRPRPVHSDRLTHELTSQRTAALQAEMMERSDVALLYLTYTLLRQVFMAQTNATLAKITTGQAALADVAKKSRAAEAFAQRGAQLKARLPGDHADGVWLAWLGQQPAADVMDMLAFCLSSTLDATQQREASSPQFVALAQALKLDMSHWWRPTAGEYFAHVAKDRMIAVLTDAVSAEAAVPLGSMTKAMAAAAAERALAEVAWLPEMMRAK